MYDNMSSLTDTRIEDEPRAQRTWIRESPLRVCAKEQQPVDQYDAADLARERADLAHIERKISIGWFDRLVLCT